MIIGRAVDPHPDEDMASDHAFRLWLEQLRPEDLAHELDPRPGSTEALILGTRYSTRESTTLNKPPERETQHDI